MGATEFEDTGHISNLPRNLYVLRREIGRTKMNIPVSLYLRRNSGRRLSVDIDDVRREVEIMRHLPAHPNIVTLKDTCEDDSYVHIVMVLMELCEEGELFDRIVARGHHTERAVATGVTKTNVVVVQDRFFSKRTS